MPTLEKARELHSQAVDRFHSARQLWDEKLAGNREWGAEEEATYSQLITESQELKSQAHSEKRSAEIESMESSLSTLESSLASPRRGRRTSPDARDFVLDAGHPDKPLQFEILRSHRGRVERELFRAEVGTTEHARHLPDRRDALRSWLSSGVPMATPLQTDFEQRAGYLAIPEQLVGELLQDLDDELWIRQLARTFTVRGAQSLGAIKRTAKASTFQWGDELDDTSTHEDSTLAFGKRRLTPHYMTGQVSASRDLLRASIIPVESLLMGEIRRDSGELEEDAFLTGTGSQQPIGLFTASAEGISTSRDVRGSNTTTAIVADTLRDMKYGLKETYRRRANWLFHRDAIKQISKLKDGDDQYLWRPGITLGDPDVILGRPVIESERVPNTFSASAYVGMLADFSYYWIADSLDIDIQMLVEKYATTNRVAWVVRRKVDAMPQIEEAFARMQLAAS